MLTDDLWEALDNAGWCHLDGGKTSPAYDNAIDAARWAGYGLAPDGKLYLLLAIPVTHEEAGYPVDLIPRDINSR